MNFLQIILIIILIFLIVMIVMSIYTLPFSNEGYSISMSKASIIPVSSGKQFYLENFENFIFSTTPKDSKLIFTISKGYISLAPNELYVDFRKMYLEKSFYIVALVPKKDQVKHPWKFEKKSGDYYLYQLFGKKKIYIYIHNHVVSGSSKNKTLFSLKKL